MRTPDELWYLVYRKYEKELKRNNYRGLCSIVSKLYLNNIITGDDRIYLHRIIDKDVTTNYNLSHDYTITFPRSIYLFAIRDTKSRKNYIKSKIMNARTKRELWFPQGVYNKICLYWDIFTFAAFLMLVLLGVMWLFATIVNWVV